MREPWCAICRVGLINCDGNDWHPKYVSGSWKPSTATSKPFLEGVVATKISPTSAQGAAHGGHKNGIHRSSESSLKCGSLQILVQNRKRMISTRTPKGTCQNLSILEQSILDPAGDVILGRADQLSSTAESRHLRLTPGPTLIEEDAEKQHLVKW
jgi:hypothetical protein